VGSETFSLAGARVAAEKQIHRRVEREAEERDLGGRLWLHRSGRQKSGFDLVFF
jgi:hypothetical protein